MLSTDELNLVFQGLGGGAEAKMEAIGRIYAEFRPFLYKKMRYRFRALSENDVQDILQDAFLKIYLSKSMPESALALPGWVFTIAENAAMDLFRKAYKKNELDWPRDTEGNFLDEVESSCPLTPNALNREVEECVSNGMKRFSSAHPERELAISMSLDGSSIADIAQTLGRTEGAVKQFIYESKKKLAPFIEHCVEVLS